MVHKQLPHTTEVAVETDPDWSTTERTQHDADQACVDSYYEKKRASAARHRWNQKQRMWEAWERLQMLKSDEDVCVRSAQGRKIQVKKMPKKPTKRSPSPATPAQKRQKHDAQSSTTHSSGGNTAMNSMGTAVNLRLTELRLAPVDPLPQLQHQPWIEKKFPLPRTGPLSRVLPKLCVCPTESRSPPYGQVLIESYRKWQHDHKMWSLFRNSQYIRARRHKDGKKEVPLCDAFFQGVEKGCTLAVQHACWNFSA